MSKPIRFGIQASQQNTTWKDLCEVWELIDELGFDTAWNFDHFFPILSDPSGPCFEAWVSLTGLAARTKHVQIGTLVNGNTYRNPAVLANMGATLDHVSGGRFILGLGGGWFEQEHVAYDIPFYTTAERIRRLDESLQIIKGLWTQKQFTFEGRYYQIKDAYCEPKPLRRPPIMIGGGGEKMTLKVAARHADIWNTFGSPAVFKHKIDVLREHCDAVGRDFNEIEISWSGLAAITESKKQKDTIVGALARAFGRPAEEVAEGLLVGSIEEVRDRVSQLIDVGVTHLIPLAAAPFNHEWIRQFAEHIIPAFRS